MSDEPEVIEYPAAEKPPPKKRRKRAPKGAIVVKWGKQTFTAADVELRGSVLMLDQGDRRCYLPIDRPVYVKGSKDAPIWAQSERGSQSSAPVGGLTAEQERAREVEQFKRRTHSQGADMWG